MNYFITGTDTDSGKTLVTSALLNHARTQLGWSTLGIKPIASGCDHTELGLRNSDALMLMQESSVIIDYQQVNPFSFEPAIAPHIAAKQQGIELNANVIDQAMNFEQFQQAKLCLIEGAGGWRLPLYEGLFLSDLVKKWQLPVILVVGVKLGCLNHAVLTQEAILADGLAIAGWIANQVDEEMSCYEENLASLHQFMKSPCLGSIPYLSEPSAVNASQFVFPERIVSVV